jgi:hypothetical protein
MPNDIDGHVLRMLREAPPPGLSSFLLTAADAVLYNPLYATTDSITNFDTGDLNGVTPGHGHHRTNVTQVKAYLNTEHPFCVVYNDVLVDSAVVACSILKGLFTLT